MRMMIAALLAGLAVSLAGGCGGDYIPLSTSQHLVLTATETAGEGPVSVTVSLDGNEILSGEIPPSGMRRFVLQDPLAPGQSVVSPGEHTLSYKLYRTLSADGHAELTLSADDQMVMSANTGGVSRGFWRRGSFDFNLQQASESDSRRVPAESLPLVGKGEFVQARPGGQQQVTFLNVPRDGQAQIDDGSGKREADVAWGSEKPAEAAVGGPTTRPDQEELAPGVTFMPATPAGSEHPAVAPLTPPNPDAPAIVPMPGGPGDLPPEQEEKPEKREPPVKFVFE